MFFRFCSPTSTNFASTLPRTCRQASSEIAIPPDFGNAFEPSRKIDAVAENVVAVDDDVADMNADAEFEPDFLRDVGVLSGNAALDFHSAAHCIHGTGEFQQHTVAGGLDDAATMRGYSRVNKGLSDSLQPGQRAFLVSPHQAAIPGYICREDCRQPSFHPLAGQKTPLRLKFGRDHQSTSV